MAADIVPELWQQIKKDFDREVEISRRIENFRRNLEKDKATAEGASLYAAELGACAARAFDKNFTEETLPDGKIYWNILERTVEPILKEIQTLVNDAAVKIQEAEDKKTGIGIKPVRAEFPVMRMRDFFNKLISVLNDGVNINDG